MKKFTALFNALDATTRTNEKVAAMVSYFNTADERAAAWAVYFLSGERIKRLIPVRKLAQWGMIEADVPEWLFEESYQAVGDLAETIALLLPAAQHEADRPLHEWIEQVLLPLQTMSDVAQRNAVVAAWRELGHSERFVWNKLLTGGFRVGVSRSLVVRALARASGVEEAVIAHRLSGVWQPSAASYRQLLARESADADQSRPYPFFLAYALESSPSELGPVADWQIEWKWDGIRAQLIRRGGQTYLWSRGEELISERFPELIDAAARLPDGLVLDGEVLPWKSAAPLPFAELQKRIGRKTLSPKILADVPVLLMVYDILEHNGDDVRALPLSERRALLEQVLSNAWTGGRLVLSPLLDAQSWTEVRRAHSGARAHGAEGLMLKQRAAAYGVGRRKGPWWKWKVQPYSVDAVMIYAQAGHGRRASLYTDYTFAVWDSGELVPFAKAYSGLTDEEIRRLDNWIRRSTIEKFGPVRSVRPEQVFEIAFEGIQRSARHRSGVAVRFPRIARWREDKKAEDADTIAVLRSLIGAA
jgi:DNA ligase-1